MDTFSWYQPEGKTVKQNEAHGYYLFHTLGREIPISTMKCEARLKNGEILHQAHYDPTVDMWRCKIDGAKTYRYASEFDEWRYEK